MNRYSLYSLTRLSTIKSREVCWWLMIREPFAQLILTQKPLISSGQPLLRYPQLKFSVTLCRVRIRVGGFLTGFESGQESSGFTGRVRFTRQANLVPDLSCDLACCIHTSNFSRHLVFEMSHSPCRECWSTPKSSVLNRRRASQFPIGSVHCTPLYLQERPEFLLYGVYVYPVCNGQPYS